MAVRENLVKTRGNLAFMLGLILTFLIAYTVENRINLFTFGFGNNVELPTSPLQLSPRPPSPLSARDYQAGRIAWQYFRNNTQSETGFANAVDGFTSTTLWDQASYFLGMISAERLGIIDQMEFDTRMSKALQSLEKLPLFDDKLPNKVYDTTSLGMSDYANAPSARGIGWSALDIARILVPLEIITYQYPKHASAVRRILARWRLDFLVAGGALQGARVNQANGTVEFIQEGRLGYEAYGARSAALLGLDISRALSPSQNTRLRRIFEIEVATDSRDFRRFEANNTLTSEPYILMALEFGLDSLSREQAHRVLSLQKQRFTETGILTAVSEDHLDQAPFFIYNSVFANGREWVALAEDGSVKNDLKTLSSKAAIAWDMIYGTPYTDLLQQRAWRASSEEKGWYAGIYESSGKINRAATANTNGIILEALHFRAFGPMLTYQKGG